MVGKERGKKGGLEHRIYDTYCVKKIGDIWNYSLAGGVPSIPSVMSLIVQLKTHFMTIFSVIPVDNILSNIST